jgi:hypothetical protein
MHSVNGAEHWPTDSITLEYDAMPMASPFCQNSYNAMRIIEPKS